MVFKGCKKCGGDMFVEDDGRERALACLQCGARTNSQPVPMKRTPVIRRVA